MRLSGLFSAPVALVGRNVAAFVEGVKEQEFVPLSPASQECAGHDIASHTRDLERQGERIQVVDTLKARKKKSFLKNHF